MKKIILLVLYCDESIINNTFTHRLTHSEYEIFKEGKKEMFVYKLWKSNKTLSNLQSEIVNHRKKVKTS